MHLQDIMHTDLIVLVWRYVQLIIMVIIQQGLVICHVLRLLCSILIRQLIYVWIFVHIFQNIMGNKISMERDRVLVPVW